MKNTLARARAKTTPITKPAAKKSAAATSRATQKLPSAAKNQSVTIEKSAAKSKPVAKAKSVAKAKPVASSKAPAKLVRAGSTPSATTVRKKLEGKAAATETARTSKKRSAKKPGARKLVIEPAFINAPTAPVKDVRATKKRAPKDLAAQYGEKEKTPRAAVAAKAPRKRRTAATRARLQEVIAPDDALLLRLARAGAISSSLAPAGAAVKPLRAAKARRSRQWEAQCGKCGKSAYYRAAAALCVNCGAILVRE